VSLFEVVKEMTLVTLMMTALETESSVKEFRMLAVSVRIISARYLQTVENKELSS